MTQSTPRPQLLLLTFAMALLLSAALLFNIQPMIGKMLLPRVGGSPYAWNIVMAFFQLALLSGYLIAHLLTRLTAIQHGLVYFGALAISCLLLPVQLPEGWHPDTAGHMSLTILYMLAMVVAVPFISLSLSAPTLQRLFAGSNHDRANDPYFLYVASNFGSFAGLLLYPFLFEPLWSTGMQAQIWQYGFYILMVIVATCLLLHRRHANMAQAPVAASTDTPSERPDWPLRAQWLLFAFIPSSLSLGVTTFITSDVTSAPMLWVLTLALYLITFMIAFTQRGESLRRWAIRWHLWLATAAVVNTMLPIILPWPVVILNLLAFFTVALAFHSRLAQLRPDARHLTEFYLWLSIGGALGGSFNAFIAPLLFSHLFEYPLILILAIALHLRNADTIGKPQKIMAVTIWIFTLGSLLLLNDYLAGNQRDDLHNILLIPLLATLMLPFRPYKHMIRACSIVMLVALFAIPLYYFNVVFAGRSFFGVIIVSDFQTDDGSFKYRLLQHGTTTHGVQYLMPGRSRDTTTYYARGTALADIWTTRNPQSIAVMGLGSGTLNCLKQPGQNVHFFEIDPLMVKVANEKFTFLRDCGQPAVTLGDGRLELAKDTSRYDLIIVDVFSSDAIPTHIITKEAITLYMSKLNPGGVLGFHISNRFFNLEPVLAAVAKELGLAAIYGSTEENESSSRKIIYQTQAMALAAAPATLSPYLQKPGIWRTAQNPRNIKAWTDDYFNILSALN